MIHFNGDLIFNETSGQVVASNGSLTLRADSTNTKSIIIGSGEALRPDRDVAIDLGRPDNRWHRMYAGAITAESGALDFLTFGNNFFIFDGGTTEIQGGDFQISLASNFNLDATSSLNCLGTASFSGPFTLNTNALPNIDNRWRLGGHNKRFGEIFASSGIFNTLSPSVSGTYITLDGSFIPNRDRIYTLGSSSSRFSEVRSSSGIFNSLTPPTSGSFINTIGSLVPDRTALYSLGTSPLRWGNIFATSGIITSFTADTVNTTTVNTTTLNASDVSISSSLVYSLDGFSITQAGSVSWDGGGNDVNISNFSQWDWGNTKLVDIDSIDATSLTVTGAANAANGVFSSATVATTFAKRPTVGGSGIALADENYYEAYGGRAINLSAVASNGTFEADNGGGAIANFDNFFINTRAAKLVNYAVNTQHVNGSQPSGWVIRMRLNSDSQFWASGAIHFDPGVVVNGTIVGQWQGNTHIPSGSRVRLTMDNNGGPTVNIVVAKAWVGLSVSGTI